MLEVIEITTAEPDKSRALAASFGVTQLAPVGETGARASETPAVESGDEFGDDEDLEILDFAPAEPAAAAGPVAPATPATEPTTQSGHAAAEPGPPATAAPAPTPTPTSDVVTVGDVPLSAALHRILCGEADEILATLDAELSLMQFDPQHRPSAGMVRASHTLCGAFRAAGFPLIAETAKALERGLVAVAPLPGRFPTRCCRRSPMRWRACADSSAA